MTNRKIRYSPISPRIAVKAAKHKNSPEAVAEVLKEIQSEHGIISQEAITDTARSLNIPPERAYGVASFYTLLDVKKAGSAPPAAHTLRVCDGPVCWLKHASQVYQKADDELPEGWRVERSSCLGLCDRAPAALVDDRQAGPLTPESVHQIPQGWSGKPADYSTPRKGELRVMMANAGKIDPDSLESALEHGVYQSLEKALKMSPEAVIAEVEQSGHAGRGGAGFPVGRKWRFVADAPATPKYIICNADESEPLIFKDRVLIDTNPHQVLEGMAVAGFATGANEAFIYIRGEYEHQARRLERAIHQAETNGWLGKDIQGSGFDFTIHVHRGAGAYICGEETALIESLEGKRGEPRVRPPYPPSYGYRGKPTLVNNVETFTAIPAIIQKGAEWYRSLSDSRSPGTKIYMVLGNINQPGLFEAPFGLTLRQVIEDYGGGMAANSEFHFALTGGAAGTIVPSSLMDIPIDYASAREGVALGAGAFLIADQHVSPVAFLRELLHFFTVESCGKCTPCRIGTKQAHEILVRLAGGKGQSGDIEALSNLADVLRTASFCGLGQSVAIPVKSSLEHFAAEFQASIAA